MYYKLLAIYVCLVWYDVKWYPVRWDVCHLKPRPSDKAKHLRFHSHPLRLLQWNATLNICHLNFVPMVLSLVFRPHLSKDHHGDMVVLILGSPCTVTPDIYPGASIFYASCPGYTGPITPGLYPLSIAVHTCIFLPVWYLQGVLGREAGLYPLSISVHTCIFLPVWYLQGVLGREVEEVG